MMIRNHKEGNLEIRIVQILIILAIWVIAITAIYFGFLTHTLLGLICLLLLYPACNARNFLEEITGKPTIQRHNIGGTSMLRSSQYP